MPSNKQINRSNRNILISTCIFLGIFLLLIGYLVYFQIAEAGKVINNPYNKRQDVLAKKVQRGDILANDGTILATTILDSEGNEVRYYPYGRLMCHTLGYVGYGGSGLENSAAYYMLASNENIWSSISNDLSGKKNLGDSIVTTIDLGLANKAYEALGDNKGAVVIIEPKTGRILAMVSTPDFDPNTINEDWDDISNDIEEAPLLNRATQGLYPPGSVFKLVTLLEYYRQNPEDYNNFSYYCDGSYEIGDNVISCVHNTAHGMQNLTECLANSCNGAFIEMGLSLELNEYSNTARELLFNEKLPINMEFSISQFLLNTSSSEWDIAQTAFGQGKTLITPIHMAMLCSAIANDGVLMEPYLIDRVINIDGKLIEEFKSAKYKKLLTEDEALFLQENMTAVIDKSFDWLFGECTYTVAGKSGTAQYGTQGMEHSLFMSYSPAENPEIAVMVVVEGGSNQSTNAAEVTKQIYEYYYNR